MIKFIVSNASSNKVLISFGVFSILYNIKFWCTSSFLSFPSSINDFTFSSIGEPFILSVTDFLNSAPNRPKKLLIFFDSQLKYVWYCLEIAFFFYKLEINLFFVFVSTNKISIFCNSFSI